jgi:hypothetical protein
MITVCGRRLLPKKLTHGVAAGCLGLDHSANSIREVAIVPKSKRKPPPTAEELSPTTMELFDQLRQESDRGAVLVGASYLHEILGAMLRKYLVDDSKVVNELLKFDRPLGSFSAQIDIAYGLG